MGFIVALLLAAVVTGQAQIADNTGYVLSELAISPFQKIVVNANIDVVLVQNDTLKKAYIEGDERWVPEISVTVSNAVLTITSRKQISYRGKVQVTVSVKELAKLEINADAGIVSFSPLHSPSIAVFINGYCDLHLKSTGKILVQAGEGYEIRDRKNSGYKTKMETSAVSEGE